VFEFITEMQPVDALVIGLLWVLSVVVSTILMWTLVIPKFLRKIILDMISTPSPDTKRAVSSLAAMIVSTPVDTGRKIKDDDGKEHPEIVPLLIYAGREIYATIQHKMSAGKGGANKKTQELMEAVAQSGGDVRSALPMALAAASKGEYGPMIIILGQELLNRKQSDTNTQGGSKW